MHRLIYIGNFVDKPKTGGEVCCFNNKKILKKIFNNNFIEYNLKKKSKIQILLNKFLFLYPGLGVTDFNKIYRVIESFCPYYVFIETAQYGILAKNIKKRFLDVKVITFFHNIEILYAKSYLSFKNPKSWYFYILTKINESCAIQYSDYRFTINSNDSKLMEDWYKVKSSFDMTFCVENKIAASDFEYILSDNRKIHKHECLFVGSNFFGNTDGLKWFIKNVLPKVDVRLTIVGNRMSKAFQNSVNICVYDFVEDLAEFYMETDFVVLPIISGGGMKTKTAEAMMFGKAIIGTSNAFVGYEIENCYGLYKCDTAESFVKVINTIYNDDIYYFNKQIYNRFTQYHSIDAGVDRFKAFIKAEI